MPVRELGVDAAVLFADIMLPLEPMGVGLRIEPEVGPIIDRPIRSAADVAALRPFDPAEVSFTLDAIRLVRRELDGTAGVIGFSGAPFTLACYLIEGRPSRDYARAKAFMYREPAAWHDLMERLSTMVVAYLRAQVEAGADVVQLFDSWVGGLGPADYARVRPAPRPADLRRPRRRARRSTSGPARRRCSSSWPTAGGDVIGVDHRVSLGGRLARAIGHDRGVQGNLDAARAPRRLGGDRGGRPRRPRRGRRPTRPRLQPRPRRAARDRTRACCGGSSSSSTRRPPDRGRRRGSRVTQPSVGRAPDDLRLAGVARARGHPRLPGPRPRRARAGPGARRRVHPALPGHRRLAARSRSPARRPPRSRTALGWPVEVGHALLRAVDRAGAAGARATRGVERRSPRSSCRRSTRRC